MNGIRLRHLVDIAPRVIKRPPAGTNITFAPMDAIADGVGGLDTTRMKPFDEVASGSYNFFENGDILLAKVTPCFENGKKGLARNLSNGMGFATSEVHVLRPRPGRINPRFLLYLLSSESFKAEGIASMTGSGGLRRVSDRAILNHRPVVIDLETQKSIAVFLDRETARIDALVAKKRSFEGLITAREASFIRKVFSSLQCKKWRLRHLGRVKGGSGFPVREQGNTSSEIPFFKVKHLKHHGIGARLVESDNTIDRLTAQRLGATIFPRGTLVFAKIGAALTLGRFSTLGIDACIDNNMSAFTPHKKLVYPDFLLLGLEQIDMNFLVQPGPLPAMNTHAFNQVRIPLPAQDVQARILDLVKRKRDRDDALRERICLSIERLTELRASLITAAVSGQIDPATYRRRGTTDLALDRIAAEMAP